MRSKIAICYLVGTLSCLLSRVVYAQDGQLDTTFAGSGGVVIYIGSSGNDEANSVVIQGDGKIIAAGFAYSPYSNEYTFALARFVANGTLDSTFGTNGTVTTGIGGSNTDSRAFSSAIQSDGKIIAAGYSSTGSAGSQRVFTLIRYNTNGSLDSTFGTNGIVTTAIGSSDDEIFSTVIQKDGKIIAAGYSYKGSLSNGDTYVFALARYNVDGSLDNTFGTKGIVTTAALPSANSPEEDEIHSLAVQSDGKIIVSGYSYGGFALARYNSDGSLDNTFGTNGIVITSISGEDYDNSVALQSDGKIVTAGTSYLNSQYEFTLARYNSNGTLDNSFGTKGVVATAVGSSDDDIHSIAIQSDGKIVAAGHSENTSQQYLFALARYDTDGSLDKTFGTDGIVTTAVAGLGDDKAYSVAIQSDGKIVAAGASLYNNFYDLYGFAVVRYTGSSGSALNAVSATADVQKTYALYQNYPNPFNPSTAISYQLSANGFVTLKIYDILGREVATLVNERQAAGTHSVTFNASDLPSGVYFYTVRSKGTSMTKKMVLLK